MHACGVLFTSRRERFLRRMDVAQKGTFCDPIVKTELEIQALKGQSPKEYDMQNGWICSLKPMLRVHLEAKFIHFNPWLSFESFAFQERNEKRSIKSFSYPHNTSCCFRLSGVQPSRRSCGQSTPSDPVADGSQRWKKTKRSLTSETPGTMERDPLFYPLFETKQDWIRIVRNGWMVRASGSLTCTPDVQLALLEKKTSDPKQTATRRIDSSSRDIAKRILLDRYSCPRTNLALRNPT